ncbi:MAG TPA: cobalamin-binding protein [Steroidobacteraceae bacterium]|nr:cobalamin-binding protein [Steroidobacteraceae bacterium]
MRLARSACAFAMVVVGSVATLRADQPVAHRIVSLAPHLTELAFDAGAGEYVVAADEYSDHPPAARRIPRVGNAFRVDFERLMALKPDAVLVWQSGTPQQTIDRVRALKIPVVDVATYKLADVAEAVRTIGRLAGTAQTADAAASRYEQALDELRKRYRDRPVLSAFLQVNDQPLYTVNGKQIMSQALELCGGRNVFAGLSELAPAVGVESVIAADPDVIISIDDTVPNPRAQWQRWKQLRAVRNDNVFALPADDLARPTLRLVAGIQSLCDTMDKAREHSNLREHAS